MTVEGMDKERLKTLASSLEPKTSAVVAYFGEVIVDRGDFEKEAWELYKEGADALVAQMGAQIAENLKKGNEIAYLIALDEEGLIATKMTVSTDGIVDLKGMPLTTDIAQVGEVTVIEEGAAICVAGVGEEGSNK